MHVSARTYLTSGIAVLGAGAIALTPIQPMPDHMTTAAPQRAVESLAVNLAASIDPFTPIVDTFKTSVANIETLVKFYLEKPLPLAQTFGANLGTYFGELTSGNAGLIPGQISNNIKTFFQAPWDPGTQFPFDAPPAVTEPVKLPIGQYVSDTNPPPPDANSPKSLLQSLLVAVLLPQAADKACYNGGDCLFVKAAPILNFLNTPWSGQALGLAGVLLSPVVQLVKSFTAVGEFFKSGDALGAINELINIPTKVTNAFLNGAGYLDLTSVVNSILPLPVKSIGLNLGGLLNAMPLDGSLGVPNDPPTIYTGGTGFDSVATVVPVGAGFATFPGIPNGWAGSVVGLGQFLGQQLLVKPPLKSAATAPVAAAAVAPKAAAAVEAPAEPATPAIPATDEAPAIPAVVEAPAAPEAPAVAATPSHRGGGGNDKSDNGSHAKGHRGAA